MVRKTGNIFIFLMLFSAFLGAQADQSLQVSITDLQNNKVSQVEIGVPFLVHVIVNNIASDAQPQGFDSWDDFAVTLYGQNQTTTSMNGKISQAKTYTYVVSAQQKGAFNVPALSMTDAQGNQIQSNSIKIVVGDAVQISQHKNAQPYILQVDLDARSVFVGQKVTALLRFGYQDSFQDLRITETPMQDIYRGYVSQEGKVGTLKIGELQYSSQDFVMELYPEKEGTLVIPTFQASFTPQRQAHVASMFAIVMGGGNVVQSQPRSIEVQALPESDEFKNITAIGQFDSVEFKLSSDKATVGEGLVAKMIVTGNGNLEVVKAGQLQMPEGLHYYEGNSSVTRLKDGKFKKEFAEQENSIYQ